jgi:hypothetical protein
MKPLINATTIARIQTILESEMRTACVIYKGGTHTADGLGGWSVGTAVTVESTVCFIGELGHSTAEREIASQNTEAVLKTIRLPHDSAIAKNHWIVADGLTYHVLGFADSDINVYKKAIVRLNR